MNDSKKNPSKDAARPIDSNPANLDPISGAPGAHPIGTALGAAPGAVAGAAVGAVVAGPVGAAIGAVAGAVAGGLAGKSAGEAVNPTEEDTYWRGRYAQESYYQTGRAYEDYAAAYRIGYESRAELADKSFEQAEQDLRARYDGARGASTLAWENARPATRAAWDRATRGPVA